MSLRLYCFDDLEGVYDDPERVARLVGLCRGLPDDAVVVGGGDDTALGSLAVLASADAVGDDPPPGFDHGRGLARPAFEAVAHDAEVPGNHDLDPGLDWAREWAASVPPAYCCHNAADAFRDTVVLERGDARVGVVGVTHPATAELLPLGLATTVSGPLPAARDGLAALRDRGVTHTVVLSHCGEHDARIARETDADAVVGGHVHERRTGTFGDTVLLRAGGPEAVLSARLGDDDPDIGRHPVAEAPIHEPTLERYRGLRAALGADEPVATLDRPVACDSDSRLRGESRVGNFLADALRAAVDADAALFPAGSRRTGPPLSGTVTLADVVSLAPFDDTVHELRLTGAELRSVLADCGRDHPGDRGWVHVHVAGLRVRWDADGDLRSVTRPDGSSLADDESYTAATTGWFVLTDGYDPANEAHVVDDRVPTLAAIVEHARDGGLGVAVEGRIARTEP